MTSASALRPPLAHRSATLLSLLNSLLLRVEGSTVALLRPLPQNFDAERDDVDLLISLEQRSRLLEIAFEATATENFHFRVLQTCSEKAQLTLWDERCGNSLKIDLWSSFSQIPNHRRKAIPAEHLLQFQADDRTGIQSESASEAIPLSAAVRLRSDVELCLLILHLAAKKKSLAAPVTRKRLESAFENLKSFSQSEASDLIDGLPDLLQVAESIRFSTVLSLQHVLLAETHLFRQLEKTDLGAQSAFLTDREPGRIISRARRWVAQQAPCIAIVGSDGTGKTTICKQLAAACPSGIVPMVAKKLYRRSLIYRLRSGLAKRTGIDRGLFDEQHCNWLTLRAAAVFWIMLVWQITTKPLRTMFGKERSRITLLDRSIGGFLIQGRKSDDPRLHSGAKIIERWLPPITTVLLSVSYAKLSQRKQEMSCLGHPLYQQILFDQSLRRLPVDLVVFSNSGNSDVAVRSIAAILNPDVLNPTVAPAEATSQRESAA